MDLQLTHEKMSTNCGFYLLDSRKPWSHDTSYPGVSQPSESARGTGLRLTFSLFRLAILLCLAEILAFSRLSRLFPRRQ